MNMRIRQGIRTIIKNTLFFIISHWNLNNAESFYPCIHKTLNYKLYLHIIYILELRIRKRIYIRPNNTYIAHTKERC